ncbi:unnamed protein product [Orchesella dallaii]|uniref:Uncharacterized protein n=1 Tax=Orchesella dallaii TaxID=48710 RepID=A0ABP1RQP8_9HEXA
MALKHSFVIAFMAFTFQVSSVTGNDGVTDDKLAMYVKPTCTNVPKFNTRSTNSSWENRVNEIRVPDKYCILVFDERDCCGRSLLITINGPSLQDKADWIGKVKSFATCEYSGADTLAMEIQDCCSNIPETKNLHPTKDELWSTSIREIKLPPGKNIRAFDNPDCKGIHLDVPHGADTNYLSTASNSKTCLSNRTVIFIYPLFLKVTPTPFPTGVLRAATSTAITEPPPPPSILLHCFLRRNPQHLKLCKTLKLF